MLMKLGTRMNAVISLREILDYLQVPAEPLVSGSLADDRAFDEDVEDAVEAFQLQNGLLADGIVGPVTYQALQDGLSERAVELSSLAGGEAAAGSDLIPLERVPAHKYKNGYDHFTLRADAAQGWTEIFERLDRAGACLSSSGGLRSLKALVNPYRSATSFHYTGRALDLFIYGAMVDADRDPLVVRRHGPREYEVFARVERPDVLPGVDVFDRVEDVIEYHPVERRTQGRTILGSFVSLTSLMKQYGFRPIRARRSFEQGGSILGAEWWHFQYELGLIEGMSTFGGELLKIYSRSSVEGTAPWRFRDHVFGKNWF